MRLIDADKLNARLSRNGTPYYTVPDIENSENWPINFDKIMEGKNG